MSFWSRILAVAVLGLSITLLLDKETRGFTGVLAANAYTLVAGAPAPTPLERPDLLTLATLDDCLRGTGHVEGTDAYAAFCEDLASIASPVLPPPLPAQRVEAEPEQMPIRAKKSARLPRAATEAACGSMGEASNGILRVMQHCRVESPVNGTVLYAGLFKGYLGIVILETAKGERVTLAGLGEVRVTRGDKAKKGDVLGLTPAETAPALADAAGDQGDGEGPALLYMTERTSSTRAARPAS